MISDFKWYKNENCTKYFENDVIKELILSGAHKEREYFGVVSYNLLKKLGWKSKRLDPVIRNTSEREFDFNHFKECANNYDVLAFSSIAPHDPVTLANKYHPKFVEYFQRVTEKIGHKWYPIFIAVPIYWNFFVAKNDIYEDYVLNWLIPAMEVMETMKELNGNSGYHKQLPEHLRGSFGMSHYPYHTFLCERLFGWYCHVNKLNVANY